MFPTAMLLQIVTNAYGIRHAAPLIFCDLKGAANKKTNQSRKGWAISYSAGTGTARQHPVAMNS
jgi:hypothetical protein